MGVALLQIANRQIGFGKRLPERLVERAVAFDGRQLLRLADLSQFPFQRDPVERFHRQAEQQHNPVVEHSVRFSERHGDLRRRPGRGGRVRDTPMHRQRVPGPDGTDFVRGVVAYRKMKSNSGPLANSSQLFERRPDTS